MNAKLNKNGIIKILNAPIPKTIPLFPLKKMGSNIINVNEIELSVIRDHVSNESVVNARGGIDSLKTGMILYDPFGTNYISLGEIVGKPWGEGKKYM